MKIKYFILLILVASITSSCIRNRYSYIRQGEEVIVNFQHSRDNHKFLALSSVPVMEVAENTRGIGLLVAPYLLKTGYSITTKIIEKNAGKATADYSAYSSDDKFYKNINTTTEINLQSIDIIRFVDSKNMNKDTASILRFKIETSADGRFMRLAPYELYINYAKARMNLRDKAIDMDVNIAIDASWIDNELKQNISELFKTDITFRNIPLRKRLSENQLSKYKTTWMPLIPRSYVSKDSWGYGNYTFKIKVTEYDDYTKRVKKEEKTPQFNDYIDRTKEVIDQINTSKSAGNE